MSEEIERERQIVADHLYLVEEILRKKRLARHRDAAEFRSSANWSLFLAARTVARSRPELVGDELRNYIAKSIYYGLIPVYRSARKEQRCVQVFVLDDGTEIEPPSREPSPVFLAELREEIAGARAEAVAWKQVYRPRLSDRQQARLDAIVRANQGLSGPKVAAKFAEMTGLKIYPYAVARARKRLGLPPSTARCNWQRKAVAS